MNIVEFIEENKITMVSTRIHSNPHIMDQDWKGNHYECVLSYNNKEFVLFYSQGQAFPGGPKKADVIDCLMSDASCIGTTFKDFADNCGYSSDSIKALKTYNNIVEQTEKLREFLGTELFNTLLSDTERL